MAALDQAKEDLGFAVTEIKTTATLGGTADDDLFFMDAAKFVGDDATLTAKNFTINGLKAGDALFLEGWTYNEGALSTGDNNVLEFFVQTAGNKTTVTYESAEFGSAVAGYTFTITLNGVADINIDDGVIFIA